MVTQIEIVGKIRQGRLVLVSTSLTIQMLRKILNEFYGKNYSHPVKQAQTEAELLVEVIDA